MGTFLLRVDERRRPAQYQTFAEAKETITRRLRSAKIASAEKQAYFDEHQEEFRLETPRYIVDALVSGGADDGLDVLREVAAMTDPAAQNSAFEAALSDRGFEAVAADGLPAALVEPISSLESGAVSDVATTGLGHFVFRLKTVEDPAFAKFDDVAIDIGALLADRAEEALQLEAVLAERDREIAIEAAHDQVLRVAFRRDFVGQIDKVSDEEAEEWWRSNGAKMMAAFGATPEAIKEVMADEERVPSMRMLKRNVLNGRMREAINERYRAEGIVVVEQMLNY
jgi:hypothetical protein